MKKVFSVFLSVIFLASAMGMTINSHFCGMKLQSVSLVEQGCCCSEGVLSDKKGTMPKGCCKNEIKVVKITDDYCPSASLHIEKTDMAPVALNFPFTPALSSSTVSQIVCNHSPPPKLDRVVAFRSLLI